MQKICGIYKITNTITGDFYIGSSKDINRRWADHKKLSTWNRYPNNQLYKDMQKYGIENFVFEILAEVEVDSLKEAEQQFIELLKPTYNSNRANGWDFERYKESQKEYRKSDKYKESHRKSSRKYNKSDKGKNYQKQYQKSDKYKETHRKSSRKYKKSDKGKESNKKAKKKYNNQLCCYNCETLTLCALSMRFRRKGISNPTAEAKKYLLK